MNQLRDCIDGNLICDGPDDSDDTNRSWRFEHDDNFRCDACLAVWRRERGEPVRSLP
jgi:hypothetical protein